MSGLLFDSQLDLFGQSDVVARRNELIEALARRDEVGSAAALVALVQVSAKDHLLADAQVLIAAMAEPEAGFADAAQALADRAHRLGVVEAAARRVLRDAAPAWVRRLHEVAAQRAAGLAFDPACAEAHAGFLWLEARNPQRAAIAVETIASWRRKPLTLAWMARARTEVAGLDAAWPLWCELAWIAPARFGQVFMALPDRRCGPWRRRFLAMAEGFEEAGHRAARDTACDADLDAGTGSRVDVQAGVWSWFPGWLVIDEPRLLAAMAAAEVPAGSEAAQAFGIACALLRLEHTGRQAEMLAQRRRLQAVSPALFAAYMATR